MNGERHPICQEVVRDKDWDDYYGFKGCGWIPYETDKDTKDVTWKLYFEPLGLKIGPFEKSVAALKNMNNIDFEPPRRSDKYPTRPEDMCKSFRDAASQETYYCKCDSPGSGTVGHNKYTCDDGTSGYCADEEECETTSMLEKTHFIQDSCRRK